MSVTSELHLLAVIGLAALLGGVLGFDRQAANKPAGLRTHMLVAAASAAIVAVGNEVFRRVGGDVGDPNRALHAVITGIGFLGAGTILRSRSGTEIRGLTTAASLFAAAVVGVAVAARLYWLGIGLSVLGLVILRLGRLVEERVLEVHPVEGERSGRAGGEPSDPT